MTHHSFRALNDLVVQRAKVDMKLQRWDASDDLDLRKTSKMVPEAFLWDAASEPEMEPTMRFSAVPLLGTVI